MSVTIAIKNIKEEEFFFRNQEFSKFSEKNLTVGYSLGFDFDESSELFSVGLRILYSYIDDNKKKTDLMRFFTTTRFHVKGLDKILKPGDGHFNLPDFYMMTFVSTAWSTTRGMLAYKLAGTFLADYYLPLIDPKEFLKQIKGSGKKSNLERNI